MRILFVVPDLTAPWSEGRKTFVCDLLRHLGNRHSLSTLATRRWDRDAGHFDAPSEYVPYRHKALQMRSLHSALKKNLAQTPRPAVLVHFPFGTFSGARGIINRHSIQTVDRIATTADVPCLTVLYSMTSGSLPALGRTVSHLVAAGGEDWTELALNIGISLAGIKPVLAPRCRKRLLFMAGYGENNLSLLQSILEERGLMQLIRVGEDLAELDYSLTIAIPLLRHAQCRERLQELLRDRAPRLDVRLDFDSTVPELFRVHDVYVFPYAVNLTRFMPTSVLEAMAWGIPVVAPRLPMLEAVVQADDGYCLGYVPGNDISFLDAVRRTCEYPEASSERATKAAEMIHRDWSIEKSAARLEEIVASVVSKKPEKRANC